MYFVYLLKLNNSNYYSGFSKNLKKRLIKHQKGNVSSTKDKLPLNLVWYCGFKDEQRARLFEKYLKSSSGFAFRNKHFIKLYLFLKY